MANCQPHCQTPRAASNVAAPSANSKPGARGHQPRRSRHRQASTPRTGSPANHPLQRQPPASRPVWRAGAISSAAPLVKLSNTVGDDEMRDGTQAQPARDTPRGASRPAPGANTRGYRPRRSANGARRKRRISRPRDHQAAGPVAPPPPNGQDGNAKAPNGRQQNAPVPPVPPPSTTASALVRSVAPFTSATHAQPARPVLNGGAEGTQSTPQSLAPGPDLHGIGKARYDMSLTPQVQAW